MNAAKKELDWVDVLVWYATRCCDGRTNTRHLRSVLGEGDLVRLRDLDTIEALFACPSD